MANSLNLLILLASLTVGQSAADDACDSVECLPAPEPVCALDEQTNSMALFADECVLRCTSCRTAAEFKKANSSLCSSETKYVTVCADFVLNHGNKETKTEGSGEGIAAVLIDIGQGSGYGEIPPDFAEPLPLPLPLMSMGSELLRRLLMSSQPEPPSPPPQGLTLITADVKVDVTINMHAPPPPPPPATRLGLPPPMGLPLPPPLPLMLQPLLAPPPPPPPSPEFVEPPESSAAPQTARPSTATAVASLLAMVVAALNI